MTASAPKYEILVVDDSPVYRKLFEQLLCDPKYSLTFASSGSEAIQKFREKPPGIVITDLIMPDISGLELCQRIRADKSEVYTYIILLTSNTEKIGVVKGLEAGADDYMVKPFDLSEMLARIGVGLRITDLHRQLEQKSAQLEEAATTDSLTGLPNRRAVRVRAQNNSKAAPQT